MKLQENDRVILGDAERVCVGIDPREVGSKK